MLGDLLAWFTKKPAIGLDTSGGGLCVLTQEPVGRDIRYTTDKPIAEDNKAQEELVTVN